jgi:rRNA maturation endonuclease Nob1
MFSYLFSDSVRRAREVDVGSKKPNRPNSDLTSSEFQLLEDKIEALRLGCAAMWSLLKDKHSLNDQELIDRIVEIDAADGKVDGRITVQSTCTSCGQKILLKTRAICVWCGAETKSEGPF